MAGRNISYVKQEEPSFLRKFKQSVGYKEGPTVDTKREALHLDEDDRSDTEDEKPTIVVLKEGDLTAEEVEEYKQQNPGEGDTETRLHEVAGPKRKDEDEQSVGRIMFKKPTKRSSDETSETKSSKKKKDTTEGDKSKRDKRGTKQIKNASLLSFDDDEEEEDDD